MLAQTQTKLAQMIQAIAQAEIETENKRVELAQKALFEPYTAFRRLDQERTGELKLSNLIEFLDDSNLKYTQNEAAYLFKKLDNDRDGRISYRDFNKFILPKEDQSLKQQASLRESYYIEVNMLLPEEVEKALGDVLQQELVNYKSSSEKKDELVGSLDYNSLEAFKTLDLFKLGYVSKENLRQFMKLQEAEMSDKEINAFFRVVDLDEDGRISYSEMVEAVHLMEPLPYEHTMPSLLDVEIRRAIETNRALERLYLSSYPYYFYPYYPRYYPSYYPSLSDLGRSSSIERIRLRQLEQDRRIREESYERLRLTALQQKLREQEYIEQERKWELQRSRDRQRELEHESYLRQIEQQRKIDAEIRLRSLERLQSLERLRHLENLRKIERDYELSKIYEPNKYLYTRFEPAVQPQQEQQQQQQTPAKPDVDKQEPQSEIKEMEPKDESATKNPPRTLNKLIQKAPGGLSTNEIHHYYYHIQIPHLKSSFSQAYFSYCIRNISRSSSAIIGIFSFLGVDSQAGYFSNCAKFLLIFADLFQSLSSYYITYNFFIYSNNKYFDILLNQQNSYLIIHILMIP